MHTLFKTLALLLLIALPLPADERLQGVACRSVHLNYPAARGVAFYNEVTVEQSAEGTYFCAIGFSAGYFGIQELGNGKKVVIFSIWDPGTQNDPKKVEEEKRVKMLYKDEKVRTGRFGNEGTGGQSFLDFDWKPGQAYRFLVKAQPEGERTVFSAYFFIPDDKAWKHLVTFSTLTTDKPGSGAGAKYLGGYYSFIEDFRRNKVSATKARRAAFGNAWVRTKDGKWEQALKARFTGDSNPVLNINAGVKDDRFFLITGGETVNTDTPLNKTIERKKDEKATGPGADVDAVLEKKG